MDIKILNKTEDELILLIKDTDHVFVNTLRRIILTEVPSLAVKEVNFHKNTSALFDEIISHRLAMISLTTDLNSYNLPENCSCKSEGCTKCHTIMTLNCEGPITVYSQDLKIQDPAVKPAEPKIPLVKLLKSQEIQFEAKITLGKGTAHAKYSPGIVFYRGVPEFNPKKKTLIKECIKACCGLLKEESGKLQITDITKWNESYEQVCFDHDVEINNSEKDFIFTIESKGKISCEEMFQGGLDVLDEKLDLFAEKLKAAK